MSHNNLFSKPRRFQISKGKPLPLGTSRVEQSVNFSIFSKQAIGVTLALFDKNATEPFARFHLDPELNKTGDIWHILIHPVREYTEYAYYVEGPNNLTLGYTFDSSKPLIDPYATLLSIQKPFGIKEAYIRAALENKTPFDWENDRAPKLPLEEMVIYEMHVRGFTIDPSSKCQYSGTFLGIVEKIPYLKKLGINAIELMPIHAFDECEYLHLNPITNEPLCNYWGYSTLNFFAPMNKYAYNQSNPIDEFKFMVKELHKEGIEVILDVVFNHTAEGNEKGPTLSFKGFENGIYYMLSQSGEYLNFSGCGNTFNCNHPIVREFIKSCLRYWVAEMHVDGFRFDLASILGRGQDGLPLANPPLLETIALDPILGSTKLIAEAWDAGGLYQVGSFPSWGVWAEWNGKFRDHVREFIKGTENMAGHFATRLCGSSDLYASSRTPSHSVNFITAHDGFTLRDLVSFNEKHNFANAENNQDGTNDNLSWNCGHEGDTNDEAIIQLRKQQIKNFITALLVSQGVPMILMGDEVGFSKQGNNNTWCHDNELNWLKWNEQDLYHEILPFITHMIHFRKSHHILRQSSFLTDEKICWHSSKCGPPDWSKKSKFVAYTLYDTIRGHNLYIAFNANYLKEEIILPPTKDLKKWHLIVDTAKKTGNDFTPPLKSKPINSAYYTQEPYSALIFKLM